MISGPESVNLLAARLGCRIEWESISFMGMNRITATYPDGETKVFRFADIEMAEPHKLFAHAAEALQRPKAVTSDSDEIEAERERGCY